MSVSFLTALRVARSLEPIAKKHGYFVTLGGGCLHKPGSRPDMDVCLVKRSDRYYHDRKAWLADCGYPVIRDKTRVVKLQAEGYTIDVTFPDEEMTA